MFECIEHQYPPKKRIFVLSSFFKPATTKSSYSNADSNNTIAIQHFQEEYHRDTLIHATNIDQKSKD